MTAILVEHMDGCNGKESNSEGAIWCLNTSISPSGLRLAEFDIHIYIFVEEKRKIAWADIDRLSWQNFEAAPDYKIDFSANTNSGISYSWNYSTSTGKPELTNEVKSNFYPDLSWVKDVNNPEYLLVHEQLHFNITELHARKLRKRLAEYEPGRRIRQDLKRLYNITETAQIWISTKISVLKKIPKIIIFQSLKRDNKEIETPKTTKTSRIIKT